VELSSFRKLLTPEGSAALREAERYSPREEDFLPVFSALSRDIPADMARAALETAILRAEGRKKFPFAGQMYFTRQALEQASSYEVSAYRALRYEGRSLFLDLGCSIGGDSITLASRALVVGVDLDPLRLNMAQANLKALGLGDRASFLLADLSQALPFQPSSGAGLFFDPARRSQGRRIFSVRDYQPPLEVVRGWQADYPAVGVKISPGVDTGEILSYDAEVEFISLQGELKEAVLWFGPLKQAVRRATLLPGPHSLVSQAPFPDSKEPITRRLPLDEPRSFLYEPDPAVLRAGLVEDLGEALGAAQLDPDIAYLTTREAIQTPFARAWRIESWFPFQLKKLRSALRERGVGRVIVKKRGSPLQPEALIRDLRLKGDQERVIFLTHLRGRPIVILSHEQVF
jgi:SAM-dependent methyltransferase